MFNKVIVYSKREYTLESVSMSGRLSDNSAKAYPIVMKFCAQNRLIDISVEFEDENDWSTPSRFIAKNVIIPVGLFHGVSPKKNISVFQSSERYPILWSLKSFICGKKISHQCRSFLKIQVSQFQLEILKIPKKRKNFAKFLGFSFFLLYGQK